MDNRQSLTAVILTYNEEQHLERCLASVSQVCSDIIIVDSFSTDKTEAIAKRYNARFFQNKWVNYATQFNWGLKHTAINTEWVLRIDADEYLTDPLINNIQSNLSTVADGVNGILVKRLMYFLDKPLKRGGMYPIWHLKLWRHNSAICEQRWMDERMKLLNGETTQFQGDLIDHNLNNLTWWTEKHNHYATREAIDILDGTYNFTNSVVVKGRFFGTSEERRRWLKTRYLKLPLFVRPIIFFHFRYILQLGFLEGKRGLVWSVLQCGWYRFLVDAKLYEAYKVAGRDKAKLITYFKDHFGYDITKLG